MDTASGLGHFMFPGRLSLFLRRLQHWQTRHDVRNCNASLTF